MLRGNAVKWPTLKSNCLSDCRIVWGDNHLGRFVWNYSTGTQKLELTIFGCTDGQDGNDCNLKSSHVFSLEQLYKTKMVCLTNQRQFPSVYLTNRFHVAVRLCINRSQMTSKCGKNKKNVTDVLTTFGRLLWSIPEQKQLRSTAT